MDDFIVDYLLEFQEGLAQFENELLELEKTPESSKILSSMFRIVHSLKGSSGFLGFSKMAKVAHEGEDLLGRLRDGRLRLTPQITSGLLAMVDGMRARLETIETTRAEDERDDSGLLALLRKLQTAPMTELVAPPAPEPKVPEAPPRIETPSAAVAPMPVPFPLDPAPAPIEPPAAPPAVENLAAEPEQTGATLGPTAADTTIRVDVLLLDKLMNLVGELVLTRNQLLRSSEVGDEVMLQASTQRLNLITTELQEGMMKTRMQPIRNLWSKLPRVVRDLALACGKQAGLVTDVEETELDKTIVEAI
jgi:two-component system chemotaxis sensor kinase CheA